jgi:hypothetical protein
MKTWQMAVAGVAVLVIGAGTGWAFAAGSDDQAVSAVAVQAPTTTSTEAVTTTVPPPTTTTTAKIAVTPTTVIVVVPAPTTPPPTRPVTTTTRLSEFDWFALYGDLPITAADDMHKLLVAVITGDSGSARTRCNLLAVQVGLVKRAPRPPSAEAASALDHVMSFTARSLTLCAQYGGGMPSTAESTIGPDFKSMADALSAYTGAASTP